MQGIFLKTPTVRMGDQNHMRGEFITVSANRPLQGVALLNVTARGPGGGGGGMVRREPEENYTAPKKADGQRGDAGQLVSNVLVSIRPTSAGYVHRAGGARAAATRGTSSALTAADGLAGSTASFADITVTSGAGGNGAWLSFPDVSNWIRSPANAVNPDGTNTAGQGGFGGNDDVYTGSPFFGSTSGQASRAWALILD